jgi:hypothetical protein
MQKDLPMFKTFDSDLTRTVVALLGALLLTTTFVGAAVAPAHMAVTGVAR